MLNLRRVSAKLLAVLGMVCAFAVGAGAQATNFGTVAVGQTSPVTQLTFTFGSGATIGSVVGMMQGAPALDFAVVSVGSCTAGASISAGGTCTANVTFSPILPGLRYGAVIVKDGSGNTVATDLVNGIGSGPQVSLVPRLPRITPPWPTVGGSTSGDNVGSGVVDGIGDVFYLVGSGAITLPMEIPAGCTSAACVMTLAPNTTIPGLPYSLALDLSGNLFITVGTGNINQVGTIWELPAAGGYQTATMLPVTFGAGDLTGIALDQSGNIFVALSGSASLQSAALGLYEVSAAGGYSTATPIASALTSPYSVAIDMSGNLFVSGSTATTTGVYEVLASGGYTTVNLLGNGFSFPDFGHAVLPALLSVDQNGDVFFIDEATFSSLDEILASGGYQTVDSILTGISPSSADVDASDNFYFFEGNAIDKVEFNDAYVTYFVPTLDGTTDTTDAQRWVTVQNIGNAPLNLTAITPPSANFVIDAGTTTCSISTPIDAGDSCIVGFDFVPSEVGALTGTLTLTDNSLNVAAATQAVYLFGTGTETPTVTVTPSPSSISTTQALSVTVAVSGGSGNPTPTGTVTLTSGSYTSAAATLSSGSATINIPAGSLATGADTLTASYTPDVASASTYTTATGSNTETVTAPATAPTVTVTPSPSSITTAQALSVTVTVGGTPTPTGSITLTSGTYSSGAVTLAAGSATINAPAGSLAVGSDTLTASYTPDSNSSSIYNSATGSNTENVTAAVIAPAATPVISPAGGTYNAAVAVQITDSSTSPTIYYTVDGSAPSVATSPTYAGVFTVTQSGIEVQAIATASGDSTSNAATPATYTVQPYLVFNPAMVGISADTAQQLTAQFSLAGTTAPTPSLHYGLDYTLGPVGCTPNGAVQLCSVAISFIPTLPGARKDALFLTSNGARVATVLLDGTGQAPLALIQPGVVTQPILNNPNTLYGSTVDENGTVYVFSASENVILALPKGGTATALPITGLNSTRSISIDGAGVLYFHGTSVDSSMMTYDTVQGVQGTSPLPGTHFWEATSVGNAGNLYAVDQNDNILYTIKPDGTNTSVQFNPAIPGPAAIAVDSAEDVFVGGQTTNEITQGGTQTGFSGVDAQNALIVDAADTIYAGPYSGFTGLAQIPASNYSGTPIADIDPAVSLALGGSMGSDGTLYIGNGNNLDKVDRSQGAINFGSQTAGTASAVQNVSLYNGGNQNLTLSNFVLAGGGSGFALQAASTNPCTVGMTIVPGALCNVAVTLTAPSAGTFSDSITFTTNTLNTSSTNQTVALSGSVSGINVTASPNPLNFANQTTGTSSAAQSVTLTNNGVSASATISQPLPTVDGYILGIGTCNSPIPPAGGTCQLSVTFDPTLAQAYDETVSLTATSSGTDPNQTVSFNVNGTGVAAAAPVAALTPASVPFGSVTSGTTSAPMSLTLSNTGNATLNIAGITIAGANPSDFALSTGANACGATLAAGASCSIFVTFTPASASSFAATLQVADDATGSPQTSTLTGTGTTPAAPVASLTPASVPFGSVTAGTTSAPMSLTLSNTGNATLNITGIAIAGANPADFALATGANACEATLAASASCSIYVTFTPASASSFGATLQLTDNATGSPQTSTLTGTGTPPPAPVATLAPTSVAFASQTTGTTSAATTVTLTNSGNAVLTITSITITGTNSTDFATTTGSNACGSSLAAGATCNIYVTFSPASAASFSATLTIADNAAGSPQTVALTGGGIAPADFTVTATPSSQTVQPGGSTTYAVTVSSSGGTFSSPVALTVTGLPAGATGSFSPSSVTPGSASAVSTLTVQTSTTAQQTARSSAWPLAAPVLAAVGLFFIPGKRRRRWISLSMLLLASLGAMTALSGCSGGFKFTQPSQTYTLTITGTSANDTHSTTVQLTVE